MTMTMVGVMTDDDDDDNNNNNNTNINNNRITRVVINVNCGHRVDYRGETTTMELLRGRLKVSPSPDLLL